MAHRSASCLALGERALRESAAERGPVGPLVGDKELSYYLPVHLVQPE